MLRKGGEHIKNLLLDHPTWLVSAGPYTCQEQCCNVQTMIVGNVQVLSIFIAIVSLATIGLSVAALILGKDASWTVYDSNGAKPEYRIK